MQAFLLQALLFDSYLFRGGTEFEKCERYDLDYAQLASRNSYTEATASVSFDELGRIPCTKWTYDKNIYESTTVTQFDLVCERSYLVATIQATYMAGAFVGSFAGGLSDGALGRRNIVLVAIVLVLIGGFGAGLASSYMMFIICRFFIAIGVSTSLQNCFTLMMEYVDTSCRAFMGLIQAIPFAVGVMILPVYAYFIRDWSNLQFAFTATSAVMLSYFWILPESSRWLISKGREEEALKVLEGIAKRNKKPAPDRAAVLEIFEACKAEFNDKLVVDESNENLPFYTRCSKGLKNFFRNYFRLVETPELRKRSIVLWILFMSVTFVYYGIIFLSVSLSSDPFLLVFMGGLMEIPGGTLIIPFVQKWGRRPIVAATFLLSGASVFAVALTPIDSPTLRIVFSMLGKAFISGTFGLLYLLGTELYPTQTRATGLGFAAFLSRFGSILAPYVVNQMNEVYTDLPSIIFGVTGIFAGIVAFSLPETRSVALLEAVDAIELIHGKSPRNKSDDNEMQLKNETLA